MAAQHDSEHITLFIKRMSGELIQFEHDLRTGFAGIRHALARYDPSAFPRDRTTFVSIDQEKLDPFALKHDDVIAVVVLEKTRAQPIRMEKVRHDELGVWMTLFSFTHNHKHIHVVRDDTTGRFTTDLFVYASPDYEYDHDSHENVVVSETWYATTYPNGYGEDENGNEIEPIPVTWMTSLELALRTRCDSLALQQFSIAYEIATRTKTPSAPIKSRNPPPPRDLWD